MLPLVESVLKKAGCSRDDIDRVAVGTGPGNFTGLRVGISLSYGLGIGLGIQVVGVCSLAAIAQAARIPSSETILVVRDARKDEFFGAAFDDAINCILEPCLIKRAELTHWIGNCARKYGPTGEPWTVAGDGLESLDIAQLALAGARIPENAVRLRPDARHVAFLGARCESSDWPLPAYIREVDAVMPSLSPNPVIDVQSFLKQQDSLD